MPLMIDITPPVGDPSHDSTQSGLAVFDLTVKATPLSITWNRETLESAVREVVAMYEGRNITEEEVPAIKTEMAGLNKIRDKLNTARRDIVNAIKSPVDAFDTDVKAITDLIIKARTGLDEQVKEFERLDREGRRTSIQFMIDTAKDKAGISDFALQLNEKWLNKTAKMSSVAAEIENLCLKESMRRTEAAQLERAKQDRVTLVGEAVKKEAAQHGFDLLMGKFAPCLSLEMTGDEVSIYVDKAFTAEAALRERAAIATPPPFVPVPAMPLAAQMKTAPVEMPIAAQATPDPWELPTTTFDFTSVESMSLTLSFSTANRAAVLELLDSLRAVAVVTYN